MAKLYTMTPNGTLYSHEITSSSFSVGGNAATGWNQHYIVLPNNYLLFHDRVTGSASGHQNIDTPFALWGPGVVFSSIVFKANNPSARPELSEQWYVYMDEIDPDNPLSAHRINVRTAGTDTNTQSRNFEVIIFGEIRTS